MQFNAGSGVFIDGCANDNLISENAISANGAKAINTNFTANRGLQKPTIMSVTYSPTGTSIAGTFTAVTGGPHRIDIYGNPTPPSVSEAQYYLQDSSGSNNAAATGPGQPFTRTNSAIVPNPAVTLTRISIGTSELSDVYRTPFSFSPGTGVNAILPTFTTFSGTAGGATQFQNVSVTNASATVVSWGVTPLTLTGDTAQFTVVGGTTPCAGASAGPNGACDIKIGFASATVGTFNAVATFSVVHNGVESKVEVPLTGTTVLLPIFTVTGATSFPNTAVNGRSNFQTVQLTNTGTATLSVSSVALDNPTNFGDSYFGDIRPSANQAYAWCGLGSDAAGAPLAGSRTLGPNESCSYNLYFKPTTTGATSGTLTFATNATPSTQTITLTGTGVTGNAPTVPTSVTATAYNGYAVVSFNPASSPDAVVGYTVVSNPAGGFDSNGGRSDTAHIITGLTNGTPYTFTVVANNGAGASTSAASNSVTPTTPVLALPKPVSQANLLAYFPFSGSNVNAMGGSPYTISAATLTGGSLSLDGALDFNNRTGVIDGVGYKTFSFSVDFNIDAGFNGGTVVMLGPNYRSIDFGVDSSMRPRLNWNNSGNSYIAGVTESVFTGTTLAKGVWYRATVVVDVGSATPTMSLYIGGALVGTVTTLTVPPLPPGFLFDVFYSNSNPSDRSFSFVNGGTGVAFRGLANNLLIYGGALTSGNVAALNTALGAMGGVINPTVLPATLSFGNNALGTASVRQIVTLTNTTGTAITITSTVNSPREFGHYMPSCGTSIPAMGTCTIEVDFSPGVTSLPTSYSGSLEIYTSAGDLVVPLTGSAVAYNVSDDGNLTYPVTVVGQTSANQTVTYTNNANANANVVFVSITGADALQFQLISNTCTPGTFNPSATCTATVRFSPSTAGVKTANITLNHVGSTYSVLISGTATPATGPVFSPSASSYTFAAQAVSTTSTSQTLTITNPGISDLTFSAIAFGGTNASDFAKSGTCSTSTPVAPASSCTVILTFTPGASGARTANLAITSDAPGSPHAIALSGSGYVPAPPTITFATSPSTISVNGTSVGTLTVTNPNPVPLTGNAFTFNYLPGLVNAPAPNASSTCAGATPSATPGAALSATTTSFTIPANGSCTFSVTITSAAAALYSGNISANLIMTSAGGSNTTPFSLNVVLGTPPTITSSAPPSGLTGTGYSFSVTASGTAPITWSIVAGSLPPGLVLNGLTGVISGTPTGAGSFTFTIRATNAAGQANLATGIAVAVPIISVISLSANDLNFGNQNVGTTSAAQIVTVGNTGNGPFNVNSVTGIGDFGFASNCTTVVPGAACTVTATFSPLTVGPLSGRISVNSTAQGGDSGISLSGTGVVVPRPNLIINPGSMIFGDQAIGSASASQIVFFSNTGQLSLILSDIRLTGSNSAGFSLTNPPTADNPRNHPMCSTTNNVAPGASCALGVVFGPTTLGGNLASISITHNATPTGAPSISSVGLRGNATPRRDPIIRVSAGLSFGEQIVDTSSTAQGVTVTNAGTADLTISGFGVESRNINTLPIDFAVAPPTSVTGNGCTAGSRLVPNASCALNITFTPTLASTLGDKSAALMIASNAVNVTSSDTRAASVSLIGTAIAEPTPLLRLSATSIGFGTVIFPTGTASRQVTLTNAGTRPLIISATGITINLGDYQQTNTCSGELAPAQSCVVTIVFTPQAFSARDATLTILSNAPGSPNRVTLTGNGCALIPPTARRSFIGTSCAN